MKKNSKLKAITLLMCFAIISQMSLPMFSVLGATTVAAASIIDDFEDATASNALWETAAAAVAAPSTMNSDYSIVTDTGNSYLMPVSQQWSPYNGYITTIKDSVWNVNRLQTFEFKEKMPAMNNNYYIDIASNVFLYQDPVTKENVRLGFSMSSDGLVGIIYNSSGMTVVNGTGYDSGNQRYPISWFDKNNWMTVKATYDYSVANTATVSLTFTNGIYVTNSSFSFSATTLASGFKVGFGSHAWNDTSWVTYYDDVELNFEKSAQNYADEFKTANSAILAKTAETVVETDRTNIMVALLAYSELAANVKALLGTEYTLLNAQLEKIGRGLTDDFEDATVSNALWETAAAVATPSTMNSDYSIVTDTGNSYLMPVSQQWSPYNGYITTIKDSVWNVNRLQTFEFKEKMPAMNNNYYIDIASNVFLYQDPATKENVRLGYTMSSGGLVGVIYNSSGMTVVNGAGYDSGNQGYPISWFDKNNWMTVKATYDYSVQNTVTVSLAFTNGIYVTNSSFSFSATTLASGFKVGFGSHAWNDTSWVTYYDDVKLDFEKSAQNYADEFKTANSAILAKTTGNVVEADRATIVEAITDYNLLTSDVKALLVSEHSILASLLSKLGHKYFDKDSFESSSYTSSVWETVAAKASPAAIVSDYSVSAGYFVPVAASYDNLAYVTAIKDAVWNPNKLQTFETKVNVPGLSVPPAYNNAYSDIASSVYLYYDVATKENIRLKFSLANNTPVAKLDCSSVITSTLVSGFSGDSHYLHGFSTTEWLGVKVTYDYSVANTIGLTLVFTHSNGSTSTCSASFEKASGFASGFKAGFGSVSSNVSNEWAIHYDDVKLKFATLTQNGVAVITSPVVIKSVANIGDVIANIQPGTQVSAFKSLISGATVVIKDAQGVNITNAVDMFIGTGSTVEITVNGVIGIYEIVVYGDINGDGSILVNDLIAMKKDLLKVTALTGIKKTAGDVSQKGSVTISDLIAVKKAILGVVAIDQNK